LKKVINLLIIFALVCGFTAGCREKDGGNYIFKYDIPVNPQTLDPQTATGQTAALLIANLYDGLLKIDSDGSIVANVASEYFISEDGLTYTFLLREDVFWYYDGDYSVQLTARDFVFAFRRLFNPAVKSENARLFYSIKNSREVNRGEIPHLDAIGVEAKGDFELVITLEHPNPLLPYLLTTSPAMPCNEELYEKTAGRYGLNAASLPSNGAFYITRWNYDPYSTNDNIIIMRRNEKNSEAERIYPRGLNFFIKYHDPLEHLLDNTTQSLIAEGETAEYLISRGYSYDSFENAVWGISFNTRRVFRNEDLRYALAASFDRDTVNVSRNGWREALEIVPPIINHGSEPYRITVGLPEYIEYNSEQSREAYERGAEAAGRHNMTGHSVIIPADEAGIAYEYLSRILQEWQVNLGYFCNIRTLSEDDFARALADGDYDIAMLKLTGDYNSPDAYLSRFSRANQLLSEARAITDITESAEAFLRAENWILEQAIFIPVCFQTEMFFYNKKCEGIIYNPFTGAVIFRDAKYF